MTGPRVLLDGRALTDGNRTRGIGTYLRGLLPELVHLSGIQVTVLTTSPALVPDGLNSVRIVRLAPPRWRESEHELLLGLDLRRVRADVLHSPALAHPTRSPLPLVITLHDLIPLTTSGYEDARPRFERLAQTARTAAVVVAVSRHTADEACRILGLNRERVLVAHHGVDPLFVPSGAEPQDPYLLLVGEYEPRRSYAAAFEVAASIPMPLKVAGTIPPWIDPLLRAEVARARRPDLIELLGYVSDEHLVALYQDAAAVLMTSCAEGFGLPALEAMACGSPTVAFRNTALEEVVGEGGVLVPDGDIRAATAAVRDLVGHPERRRALSVAAVAQAAKFTWAHSARVHAEAYRLAFASA